MAAGRPEAHSGQPVPQGAVARCGGQRTRDREERFGGVDHPVVALDGGGHARDRDGEHRLSAKNKDLGGAGEVVQPLHRPALVRACGDVPVLPGEGTRGDLAVRFRRVEQEQHRGVRGAAQPGEADRRGLRRGECHRRHDMGGHGRGPDGQRHGDPVAGVREPDTEHRTVPGVLPEVPGPLASPPRGQPHRGHHQQGAAGPVGGGLRRGERLRQGARAGDIPRRVGHAAHLRGAGPPGEGTEAPGAGHRQGA